MGKKRKELSQEEIWDDSGLIESWNQSYEEYKRYHSIHARGDDVKDLIEKAKEAERQGKTLLQSITAPDSGVLPETKSGEDLEEGELPQNQNLLPTQHVEGRDEQEDFDGVKSPSAIDRSLPRDSSRVFDNVVRGSSHDEGLKNLMMSWYWAGYYTGYYEGQRPLEARSKNGSV